eukprot:CAMPEP_0206208486 /NCGR_PEP_ID=MMETSP0166-20121206/16301_1 /ASSEMBLY_ACC=CAM_ASM_000260 /TAXON_ID=95228 /ORGANISM="Vannella robusta, Strain DIVA3 518/3/11/1/6" /LENGTH=94 /DNA_ID=CAMNT_0053629619 /DNA_START=175 /DNA_END=455 /DNA_ORIENTATION=+
MKSKSFQKDYVPPTTYTLPSLTRQVNDLSVEAINRLGLLPLKPVASFSDLDIQYEYGHVFVAGRYNKYSRSLSQTAWIIDGVRRGESSVEELIT